MANAKTKKLKIYQEEAKTRQTSHWDWDYMGAEEYDALMRKSMEQRFEQADPAQPASGQKHFFPWWKLCVSLVCGVFLATGILWLVWPSP
jgi:hypothetical protein